MFINFLIGHGPWNKEQSIRFSGDLHSDLDVIRLFPVPSQNFHKLHNLFSNLVNTQTNEQTSKMNDIFS